MFEAALARAEKRAEIETALARQRFINGLGWLLRDTRSVVGRTPWEPVLEQGKLVVRRYRSPGRRASFSPPILCVPPLGVRPFVFDLYPEQSVVGLLLEEGFDVYLVDYGVPDETDQDLTLDDYVGRFVPTACEAVRSDSGCREISLLGYCLGAIFAMTHVVANRDDDVRNVVDVGAPVDITRTGAMGALMQVLATQTEEIVKRSNGVSAEAAGAMFRMITPVRNVTRYADLFLNMWDREYVDGFDAMNEWINQLIGWPRDAYLQLSRDFNRKNLLAEGRWTVAGRGADLAEFRASLLVLAGRGDSLAPPAAVKRVLDLVGSEDKTFREVPGGHMGVLAGRRARNEVWRPTARWLIERSDALAVS